MRDESVRAAGLLVSLLARAWMLLMTVVFLATSISDHDLIEGGIAAVFTAVLAVLTLRRYRSWRARREPSPG